MPPRILLRSIRASLLRRIATTEIKRNANNNDESSKGPTIVDGRQNGNPISRLHMASTVSREAVQIS
jgi:hypothetical protein